MLLRIGVSLLLKTAGKSLKPGSQGQELIPAADIVSQMGRRQIPEVFGDTSKMLRSGLRHFVVHCSATFRPSGTR